MADVVVGGVRLHALRLGQGEPLVVFIHGLALDNLSSFYMSLAPGVAKHASVLLYDLRGHGLSEQTPEGYTGDDMVADLAALLDALVPPSQRVVVLGHSFGGYIALRFAVRHPERLRGLVLLEAKSGVQDIGTSVGELIALTGEARAARLKELFGHWLAKHAARGHADVDHVALDELDADGRATAKFAGRLAGRRRSPMLRTAQRLRDQTSFLRDVTATPPLDDAVLARIACPTLAVYGELSDLRVEGERLARVLLRCELAIVPGIAHGVLFHATPQVREALLGWLADLP
jgi:pimeloyl-ACP methyl ester carboxylesterase